MTTTSTRITDSQKILFLAQRSQGQTPAPGKVIERRLQRDPQQKYFLYIPETRKARRPVFVSVHGIRRRAELHARAFAPFAERQGVVLVAPLFPKNRFPDYQRLGRRGKGQRADLTLNRILAEVDRLTQTDADKIFMFGFSGGSQFVHRYAMAYPRRVAAMALAAAGWYTFPDFEVGFPRGIKSTRDLPDVRFDPLRFLGIPTQVLVGDEDVDRDDNFNKNRRLDLQQGLNRKERGLAWISAMHSISTRLKFRTPYLYDVMPECNHSFLDCMRRGKMGTRVFNFFLQVTRAVIPEFSSSV
jgi:pimeloyl-ACP methyl ester carboxylesterase